MTAIRPKLETDRSLRSSVIRLAHAQPDLRPHLLPLLKQADSAEEEVEVEAALLWRRKYEGTTTRSSKRTLTSTSPRSTR